MNIEEYFRDNRKYIWLFGLIYLIVIILVIYFIWKPEKIENNEIVKYDEKEYDNLSQKAIEAYIQEIPYALMLNREYELEENISKEYLKYTDQTFDELIKELKDEGFTSYDTQIKDITTYILGDTYIYRGILYDGKDSSRYINIVEDYPYEYEIAFDDFYKYSEQEKSTTVDGIQFKLLRKTNNINTIIFKIQLTNLSNNYVKVLLDDETKIALKLTTGEIYYASLLKQNTSKVTTINKNSKATKEIAFSVPLQLQEKIEKIIFKDVQSDGEEKDVDVKF